MPPAAERKQREQDRVILIAIVLLILAGLSVDQFTRRLTLLLAPMGIPPLSVVALVALLRDEGGLTLPTPQPGQGAERSMRRSMVSRRAMYMLAAARRLATGGTVDGERRLYRAHLAAERRRHGAARRVDAAAAQHGPVLGWWAVRDDRTTPACFAAHGSNFSALSPPAIGWPGTIHAGQCRCKAVAPWPEGDFLEGTPAAVEDRLLTPLEW